MSKILFSFSLSFQTEMCGITVTDICYPFSLDDVLRLEQLQIEKMTSSPASLHQINTLKMGKKLCKKIYLVPIFLPFNSKTVPIAKTMANIR